VRLFRDQESGVFQLANRGPRKPERIDRVPLVDTLSIAWLERQVDSQSKRGMGFPRLGLTDRSETNQVRM
jgi:hypothetical protein